MNKAQLAKIGADKRTQRPSKKHAGRDANGKRLPHTPNDKTRAECIELAKKGGDVDDIAIVLDLTPAQVRDHYGKVIDRELALLHLEVIEAIKHAAVGAVLPDTHISVSLPKGKDTPIITKIPLKKHLPPNVAAQQFWLRNRIPDRWRKDLGIDPQGSPDDVAAKVRERLRQLSEAEEQPHVDTGSKTSSSGGKA